MECYKMFENKNSYQRLGINKKNLEGKTEEEIDSYIKEKMANSMKTISVSEKEAKTFHKKSQINTLKMIIKEAYEHIKDATARAKYQANIEKEQNENKINEELEREANHEDDCDEKLILNATDMPRGKAIEETPVEGARAFKIDNKEIRRVARVKFKDYTGIVESFVDKYQVSRKREDGTEINLKEYYTLLDENTMMNYTEESKEYQKAVLELFSDEMLEISEKYNGNYLGLIKEKEEGKYGLSITEKLSDDERKMLTVAKIKNGQIGKGEVEGR